jgi:hypothetical protein
MTLPAPTQTGVETRKVRLVLAWMAADAQSVRGIWRVRDQATVSFAKARARLAASAKAIAVDGSCSSLEYQLMATKK